MPKSGDSCIRKSVHYAYKKIKKAVGKKMIREHRAVILAALEGVFQDGRAQSSTEHQVVLLPVERRSRGKKTRLAVVNSGSGTHTPSPDKLRSDNIDGV